MTFDIWKAAPVIWVIAIAASALALAPSVTSFTAWAVMAGVALGPPYLMFRMRAHNELSLSQSISRARR